MPGGGKKAPLTGIIAGAQDMIARFRTVWGTAGLFSPGEPLVPVEPEKTRIWDFPVGWNYIYTPRSHEAIGFAELRALAENHDITRLAIETRKDQIERLDWHIVPRDPDDIAANADKRIAALTAFWRHPDGELPFATWLREALEDLLVIDAPSFELRRNRGGGIIGLDVVDGATIKVLIDDTGRRPPPPAPAYEQVIHGRPWRLLSADELLYLPRNRRPFKAYGFSPVEQIVMTVNIALRRQVMQLQHFTEGNVPIGLLNAPDNWTAEQIRQFQEWFDASLAGNTAERTKLIWGPAGAKYQAFKEAPYKDDLDEWLARVVCYAFSLPPTAFVRQVNRATADTAQEAALSEGLGPLLSWVKHLADEVMQRCMGHDDLEFVWADQKPINALEQAQVLQIYVKEGIKTRNEARNLLGDDPMEGGDALMVDTGQGPVPLSNADPILRHPAGNPSEVSTASGPSAPAAEGAAGVGADGNEAVTTSPFTHCA
jgi:HK97 family phage portal protein